MAHGIPLHRLQLPDGGRAGLHVRRVAMGAAAGGRPLLRLPALRPRDAHLRRADGGRRPLPLLRHERRLLDVAEPPGHWLARESR